MTLKRWKRKESLTKTTSFISQLQSFLSLDPYLSDFEAITKKIHVLKEEQRKVLLEICEKAFKEKQVKKNEPTRVACSKILVALVPDSINVIKGLINRLNGKTTYEIHFSLFCFLDNVPDLPNGKAFTEEIPLIVEKYLLNINTETAHAAFMAGDLLGDHWDVNISFPILMKITKDAKYWVGRENAIGGLEHLINKLQEDDFKRKLIIDMIKKASKNDRSNHVRVAARIFLNDISKEKVK